MVIYHKGWDKGKLMGETIEEEIANVLAANPIEFEEKIPTLDRPLIIENAFPGWQPRNWGPKKLYPSLPPGYKEGGIRFEAVPTSVEEQVTQSVEAVKAGAACLHIHPRSPDKDASALNDPKAMAEIYDAVFQKVDAVTLQHTWSMKEGLIDYVTHGEKVLKLGEGNKYCQGAVVLWPPADTYPVNYTTEVQRGVKFMLDNDIKPIHKLRSSYGVRKLKRLLIDTGVEPGPYVLVHDMGHPFGWPMDQDPWMPIDLITSINQTRQRIPDSVIGVYSGGRNWLPITIIAILAGVDIVRAGIEDSYWIYPHRDDVIQRNIDAVKKITEFAHLIGREVATVEQARNILGVKRTS
jgi:3-keto-5-aminohexanoate cleavage enzyme